jgi:hypothetical protein
VAAHAAEGLAGFGLNNDDRVLQLTALGAEAAQYIVVVPDNIRVRISLPDRRGWRPADGRGAANFSWDVTTAPVPVDYAPPVPTIEGRFFLLQSTPDAPARVRLRNPTHIRSVELRLEGTDFRIASSRPLNATSGSADLVDVDPGRHDIDLLIQVPPFTRQFDLRLGATTIVAVRNGEPVTVCGPAVRQKTSEGAWRVTYRPSGAAACGGTPALTQPGDRGSNPAPGQSPNRVDLNGH